MRTEKRKNKDGILSKSPINYFSDLFIVAMVVMWIADNIYESLIATAVTLSSIYLSLTTGEALYDTTMWSSIGNSVAIPLATGGALYLLKCGVQHAIANMSGKQVAQDFPKVDVEEIEFERAASDEAPADA